LSYIKANMTNAQMFGVNHKSISLTKNLRLAKKLEVQEKHGSREKSEIR